MKIKLPEGFEIPDDVQPGEPFEVVATLEVSDDGSFELVAIDGVELSDEPEKEEVVVEEETPMTRMAAKVALPWPEEDED